MKKLLALLLALALVLGLVGCQLPGAAEVPADGNISAEDSVTEAPADETPEPPAPEISEEPVEEATEEETIYDPRPHPADVEAEQDRINAEQDRDEANRQEQEDDRQPDPEPEPEPDPEPEPEPETEPAPEPEPEPETEPPQADEEEEDTPSGTYYNTKDEVALYIHLYGCLPDNYITKSEAKRLYGSTKNIPSNMNIGGDRFYNKEGLLPQGHTYYECDIDTTGGRNRGAKRIVFSSDGLIYYTDDHYASFTLLYGEP